MRVTLLCTWLIAHFVLAVSAFLPASAQEISGAHPDPKYYAILGSAWTLFLNGEIAPDSGAKLEAFIRNNNVPAESFIVLNSPGGNLAGGMELGRLIRKYRLRTDVGIQKSPGSQDYGIGGCFSSCSLAFVGGKFRYLKSGSRLGIHRFSFVKPQKGETDLAQIASAFIVAYLREMGIDSDFFTLSTTAGSNEIYEPSKQILEKLSVINNGFSKTSWSIESVSGFLYVKGQRDTVYGINKFILSCIKKHIYLYVIFDPQNRENEVINILNAHSLVIDGKPQPIAALSKTVKNGWINAEFLLNLIQLEEIRKAKTVGVIFQIVYGGPIFLGFDAMPTQGGTEKLAGLMNSCGM